MNYISASQQIGFPILSVVTFIPLVGALFILFFINSEKVEQIRKIALVVTIIDFLVSLVLLIKFKHGTADMQFVEHTKWISAIGAEYFVAVDGISLTLVLLTTFLAPLTLLSTWKAIDFRVKEFMVHMLILQAASIGVFVALDMFLFYVYFEVLLVPMYFVVAIWGGARRLYSAAKFFIYTLAGSVFMLLGLLAIYFYNHSVTGIYTFSWAEWVKLSIPIHMQFWIFFGFFLGFAIKVPMFPFHTWLPDTHVDAPTAGSVVLAGVLLKVGTYAFVRLSLPLLPEACFKYGDVVIVLGLVGIVYTAFVAFPQKDAKKLVAYSSVAHLGYVMLGVFALNYEGITGGILQMLNHGLSTSAMFLLIGLIYERRHTRMIADFGGLFKVTPIFATIFAVIVLSSVGVPGLNGFIGEIYVLGGAIKFNQSYALIGGFGILLGYIYTFWMFQRVVLMDVTKEENAKLKDMDSRELWTLLPIVVACFWIGLYPVPVFNILDPSVKNLTNFLEARQPKPEEHTRIEKAGSTKKQTITLKGQKVIIKNSRVEASLSTAEQEISKKISGRYVDGCGA